VTSWSRGLMAKHIRAFVSYLTYLFIAWRLRTISSRLTDFASEEKRRWYFGHLYNKLQPYPDVKFPWLWIIWAERCLFLDPPYPPSRTPISLSSPVSHKNRSQSKTSPKQQELSLSLTHTHTRFFISLFSTFILLLKLQRCTILL